MSKNLKVTESEYSGYGATTGTADKPEDPRRYAPKLVRAADVLKKFGWTDLDVIRQAQATGFPSACKFEEVRKEGILVSRTGVYDAEKIAEWRERLRVLGNFKG